MMKINYWKISTFIFASIFLFLLISIILSSAKKTEAYDFNGLNIPRAELDNLASSVDSNTFILCDVQEDKCVTLSKVN